MLITIYLGFAHLTKETKYLPRCKISVELGLEASKFLILISVRGDRDILLAPKMIIQYNKWESIQKQWMNEALSSDENSFA